MGDPRVLPRGEWQKTMANTILDMTKKALIKDEGKVVIGHQIDVRVKKTKNNSYDGALVYTVNFYNEGGFNPIDEYAQIFCELGIVSVGGAGWTTFPNINAEEIKVQGMDAFVTYLKENPEDFEFLKKQIDA